MLFSNRQALISSYCRVGPISHQLFHQLHLIGRVWHRQLVTTNDDPEIVRQRPINVRVKLVSILEDESEDPLRHFHSMVHISHNSLYYKCFSGNGKPYFRFLRFFATMRCARRLRALRSSASSRSPLTRRAASFAITRSVYV